MDPLPDTHRRLAAILLTDMVGFSALTQKNETQALALLNQHFTFLRPFFAEFRGHEIKTMGDSFLVEFPSAADAVHCAIKIQQSILTRNTSVPAANQFEIRIGIHIGDIFFQGNDIFGDGVNITARIEPLAPVSGICFSQAVFDQIQIKLPYPVVPLRPTRLKNITKNIPLFTVDVKGFQRRTASKMGIASAAAAVSLIAGLAFYLPKVHQSPAPPAPPATAWFDAGDLPGQPGTPISSWPSKGDSALTAIQTDPAHQPTVRVTKAGFKAIEFDGSSQFLSLDSIKDLIKNANAVTFFYVAQTKSNQTQYVFTCYQPDVVDDVFRGGFKAGNIHFVSTLHNNTTVGRLDSRTGWSVYRFVVRAENVSIAQNGSVLGNFKIPKVAFEKTEYCAVGQDWDPPSETQSGAGPKIPSDFFKGQLAELLVYTRVLSNDEIMTTESYLQGKYSITASDR